MGTRLCILCCSNFEREVRASIAAEGWDDVAVAGFPARCGRPPVDWNELRRLTPDGCSQVMVFGRACLTHLAPPPAGQPAVRTVSLNQCFHLVAGEQLVSEALAAGAYLMTPAWLADWRQQLDRLGFSPGQAGEFFQGFAKELVLLDTGIDPGAMQHAAEITAALCLPVRRIAVGLDYLRLGLAKFVLEWRQTEERRARSEAERLHGAELADHIAAMDLLTRLARTQTEVEAIAAIEELFSMLFAPGAFYYLRVENNVPVSETEIPEAIGAAMRQLQTDYAWTADGQGFLLRIAQGETVLGVIGLERLAFPAYRERYLNLALAVVGVCGLAIENARNRCRLLEAEKMAALGIVVAGVAHEINTPLGVVMTAASASQGHAKRLSERFAARCMTQSDLQAYLQAAETSSALVMKNLERIGHLVNAFREVAVDHRPVEWPSIRLRECIDDVLSLFGEKLETRKVSVVVECDAALEVTSQHRDWVTIFSNLIDNALKHAFSGRDAGQIRLRVSVGGNLLRVEYQDDGVGMGSEVLARIFNPFFTTDLQNGLGLGMHLVFNLVTHRLGGVIVCKSQPGAGTSVLIEVPNRTIAEAM